MKLTNKEACEWLIAIKRDYIHGGDEDYDERRKLALDMGAEALENQKTGHWIEGQRNNLEIHNILCSNCLEGYPSKGHANSQYTREKFKFCPNCGAKMEGEKE